MFKINIGDHVRKIRKEKGFTSRELSRRSGVSQPYLSQLETGKNTNPTQTMISKLAKGLGIPNGDLMMLAGYIDEPFEHSYKNSKYNLISSTDSDVHYLLNIKDEAYYNGKLLSNEDKELATNVLDKLFKE